MIAEHCLIFRERRRHLLCRSRGSCCSRRPACMSDGHQKKHARPSVAGSTSALIAGSQAGAHSQFFSLRASAIVVSPYGQAERVAESYSCQCPAAHGEAGLVDETEQPALSVSGDSTRLASRTDWASGIVVACFLGATTQWTPDRGRPLRVCVIRCTRALVPAGLEQRSVE